MKILLYLCAVNNVNMTKTMGKKKYVYDYPHPAVATDCVIFGFDGEQLQVLLIERGVEPFMGCWAFPGGFLRMNESADEGAQRELREETGLKVEHIEQFYTFSDVKRDPRERVLSIAYFALVKIAEVQGGDDARRAQWFNIEDIPQLAFDHDLILRKALARLKEKIHFEPIGFDLLPEIFKMSELQKLYEAILEVKFDRRNFYKKMNALELLIPAEERSANTASRIPVKYRFNAAKYNELKRKGFRLEF